MERVTGLGGPFIKAEDPKGLAAWYEKHLGIAFNGTFYTVLPFTNKDGSEKQGYNVLSFFKSDSDYFAPSNKPIMLNFMVFVCFAGCFKRRRRNYSWRTDGRRVWEIWLDYGPGGE